MKMVLTFLHFIQQAVKAAGSLHKGEQNQCVYLPHTTSPAANFIIFFYYEHGCYH
jgi:hypothetical protein